MQFPLSEFEQHIEESILKRGLTYFKQGKVHDLEELSPGAYEASVEGNENYLVEIKIERNKVVDFECDCPYHDGPICKHVVAVLFYILEEELGLLEVPSKGKTKKSKPSTVKSTQVLMKELLGKLSHEDVKKFLMEYGTKNKEFRTEFVAAFAPQSSGDSLALYTREIKSIINANKGRFGVIEWNKIGKVCKEIEKIFDRGHDHYEDQNYKSAIYIMFAIVEHLAEALQYTDDSSGYLSGIAHMAADLLQFMSGEEFVHEDERKLIFDYAVEYFRKETFKGWDWHYQMLEIATDAMSSNADAEKVFQLLEKPATSEYEFDTQRSIYLKAIRFRDGEEAAQEYLEENLDNTEFRVMAIEKAIENKNYKKAIQLAEDGIIQDKTNKPGLVGQWYHYLLQVAIETNDKYKIIQYSRFLIIENFTRNEDYFGILKNTIAPEQWIDTRTTLIKDINKQKHWQSEDITRNIYVREQMWDELLESIGQTTHLPIIEQFEKYFPPEYHKKIISLYYYAVMDYVETNVSRSHYKHACRYLNRMSQMGGIAEVSELVAGFKRNFPQRKALMEELNKIV